MPDTLTEPADVGDTVPPGSAAGSDEPPTSDSGVLDRWRARLSSPMPADGHWGWTGPLAVTAIAAVLRFVDLSRPRRFVFDETYYAKDAWSLVNHGYARKFVNDANERILNGDLDVYADGAAYTVHPEVAKWIIGLGERMFGLDPFGWRVGVAVVGTLTVFVLARLARRLFRSTLLGCIAGLLLAVDGLAIVMSRTAILDGVLAFFIVAAVACLLVDRDWSRERLARWAVARDAGELVPEGGPLLAWRPWRLAAGVCFGLACGTKWNGVFALAVFAVAALVWDVLARRTVRSVAPVARGIFVDGPIAFVTLVGTAVVTYVITWSGWIFTSGGWSRQWSAEHPASGLVGVVPDWLRSLWHYHGEMLRFHTNLTTDHDYESKAFGWLVLWRPISFDYQEVAPGTAGCDAARCAQEVLAIGTPAIWWAGCLAILIALAMWLLRGDWRPGVAVLGVAATWLPWFYYWDRTIFFFYAVTILPFMILAITYVLGLVLGRSNTSAARRAVGAALVGGFVLLVVVNAAYMYPLAVDQIIPYDSWRDRMWFHNWI